MSIYELPAELRRAATRDLTGQGAQLQKGAADLTATYRKGGRSTESMDFGAYLAVRLPATFAAVTRVLIEAREHIPDFEPSSVVDVGAGPGTASWAATELFDSIQGVDFVDNNPLLLDLALGLARQATHDGLRSARGHHKGMDADLPNGDLVIAAYALAEIPVDRAGQMARHLWNRADQALVIVEPGTPAGYQRILAARQALIAENATIAAPCLHQAACPISGTDWCHFSVRLPRSRLHMQVKGASVPYEDERFSYLIATRSALEHSGRRILSPVTQTKAGIGLRLCGPEGIETRVVAKREGQIFKRAKKADWGDTFT